jgi:acylphosphatase
MIHKNITISGKVQKTGFRFSSMQLAMKLGICGFIKNIPDGKLYLEAEGPEDKMEEFIKWCRTGPMCSRVCQITIEKGEVMNLVSFEIYVK